jgi:transcriptional regulator with XRE-family HTH domain
VVTFIGIRNQYAVAQVVGIGPHVLSAIEHGRKAPDVRLLVNLLIVLKCSGAEFGRWFGPWGNVDDLPRLGQTKRQGRR